MLSTRKTHPPGLCLRPQKDVYTTSRISNLGNPGFHRCRGAASQVPSAADGVVQGCGLGGDAFLCVKSVKKGPSSNKNGGFRFDFPFNQERASSQDTLTHTHILWTEGSAPSCIQLVDIHRGLQNKSVHEDLLIPVRFYVHLRGC